MILFSIKYLLLYEWDKILTGASNNLWYYLGDLGITLKSCYKNLFRLTNSFN